MAVTAEAVRRLFPAAPTAAATVIAAAEPTSATVAVLGTVTAVAVAFLSYRTSANQQKTTLHTEQISGSDRLVKHLEDRLTAAVARSDIDRKAVDSLRNETLSLQRRMLALELGARRLAHQVEMLGHVPVWHPDHPDRHHPPGPDVPGPDPGRPTT